MNKMRKKTPPPKLPKTLTAMMKRKVISLLARRRRRREEEGSVRSRAEAAAEKGFRRLWGEADPKIAAGLRFHAK